MSSESDDFEGFNVDIGSDVSKYLSYDNFMNVIL